MGTIFVAYGEPGYRTEVLEFAARQAAASEHDLFVTTFKSDDESAQQIREEIEGVIENTAPEVACNTKINQRGEASDQTNVSRQKRLIDAILESDTDTNTSSWGTSNAAQARGSLTRVRPKPSSKPTRSISC